MMCTTSVPARVRCAVEKIMLTEILNQDNPAIYYVYDFGDGWEHKIILDEVKFLVKPFGKPKCINGERNCLPEDCGGVGGYY